MGVTLIKVTAYISKVIITKEISAVLVLEPASTWVRSIFLYGPPIEQEGDRTRIDTRVPRWECSKYLVLN
jgi:hypothetical protein